MQRLQSYLCDTWQDGQGEGRALVNPSTEAVVATTTTRGLDLGAAAHYARTVGGPALRALTFAERGSLLKAMARAIYEHREALLDLSRDNNGTTRGDGKFDIDGATGTLAAYARLGRDLGERTFLLDGEAEKLGSGARYVGQHVRMPRPGVAVHINAFNFPAWGTFEKIAVAFLAGVPVITKPATATAHLTWRMVQILVESGILPAGSLSLLCGSAGDLLDHLGPQDGVAFTGSADTGAVLRGHACVVERSTRINIEADSLNSAVLGPDVVPGTDLWHCAVRNIVKDITQKTGQKCTAVRRIMVPEAVADDLSSALAEELGRVQVGYPVDRSVGMGPVATAAQLRDVRAGIEALCEEADVVVGGTAPVQAAHTESGTGFFVAPTLLRARDAASATRLHELEVFGPCSTLMPYDGSVDAAGDLLAKGQGMLVSSVYADDRSWVGGLLPHAAAWNGRVVMASKKVADQVLPPGMVLPNQMHGGPGRAGGGEELGGLRGLEFYTNRTALQGDAGVLRKLL
ncbi:MAG: aldehyde dehydrogenase [Deltaproteobacteria bacterium]|nr:aldehyde dehydrogenase [Deltaproteobacteria bacterium]